MRLKAVTGIVLMVLLVGVLMLVFNVQQAESSEPSVTAWNRTYGGSDHDIARSIIQTSDGGYALAGVTMSVRPDNPDFWLVKVGSSGNMIWNQAYGGDHHDEAYSVIQTSDGGYALAGYLASSGSSSDFWLVKTNASGDVEWSQTYGGTGSDLAYSVIQTSEGGYALAGQTSSFGAGATDFWLVKTSASGDVEWSQTYGGTSFDTAASVIQTSDGGYALAGSTESFGAGVWDFWLVKTSASGDVEWSQTYGGANFDNAFSVVQTTYLGTPTGYAIAGYTYSYGAGYDDFWLVRTDLSGNWKWNKTYGGADYNAAASLVQTSDNGFALAGYTGSFEAFNLDFWLVKTNAGGTIEWTKTYGGADYDFANSVVQTSDGGYAVAGSTRSFGAGAEDFWLIKTSAHPSTHTLAISTTTGGTTSPSPGTYTYSEEESVTVTAIPQINYYFHHWVLDWLNMFGNPTTIQMDKDHTLKAVFKYYVPVGGVWVPVDKFGLLAPYIGLASTILVATAIYVKRVKRRKEKQ